MHSAMKSEQTALSERRNDMKKILSKAKGFFDGLVNSVQNSGQNNTPSNAQTYSTPVDPAPVQSAAPSGVSWGEVMPAEENQFSFGGSFDEYFEVTRQEGLKKVYKKQKQEKDK